jgi:DNA-binding response OmpR family regulator
MKILVVEDSPDDAGLVRILLTEAMPLAVTVVVAETLAQGVAAARAGADLVVLDLGLPDSRGLGTFDKFREAAPGVPVIVMSGMDDEALAERAVRHGAQDYLVKGQFDARALRKSVRYALARGQWASGTEALGKVNASLQAVLDSLQVLAGAVSDLNQAMVPRVP